MCSQELWQCARPCSGDELRSLKRQKKVRRTLGCRSLQTGCYRLGDPGSWEQRCGDVLRIRVGNVVGPGCSQSHVPGFSRLLWSPFLPPLSGTDGATPDRADFTEWGHFSVVTVFISSCKKHTENNHAQFHALGSPSLSHYTGRNFLLRPEAGHPTGHQLMPHLWTHILIVWWLFSESVLDCNFSGNKCRSFWPTLPL